VPVNSDIRHRHENKFIYDFDITKPSSI